MTTPVHSTVPPPATLIAALWQGAAPATECPAHGYQSEGRYCSICGESLRVKPRCPCGQPLGALALFCINCGRKRD